MRCMNTQSKKRTDYFLLRIDGELNIFPHATINTNNHAPYTTSFSPAWSQSPNRFCL